MADWGVIVFGTGLVAFLGRFTPEAIGTDEPLVRRSIRRRTPYSFIALMLLLTEPALAADSQRIVSHGGLQRSAWIVDGRADTARPAPLVLALHGYRSPEAALELGDHPEKLGWTRLSALAREHGFVAVYPAAVRGQWNLVSGLKNTAKDDGTPIDDVGFLHALVSDLQDRGTVDPSRLYITGISDGAIMTHRMICRRDTPFAAAAALAGSAHEDHLSDCAPIPPPALLQVHGDNDQVLPYDGWIFRTGREVSVPEVMDHWRRLHGCTGQSGERLDDTDPTDGSTVLRLDWTGCTGEPNVRLFKIKGGGHSVPALDAPRRDDPGKQANRDLDTMAEVWRFLSAARRPPEK